MAFELAWKSDSYGPQSPYVVVKHVAPCDDYRLGTYGVYKATTAQGHVRPIGCAYGATLEGAIEKAQEMNNNKILGITSDGQRSF